jgi:hypothetical protein
MPRILVAGCNVADFGAFAAEWAEAHVRMVAGG